MKCPNCGNELDEDNYCSQCFSYFNEEDYSCEQDYDSMVNNGDEICLNCTYWSVSPLGAAYGMECRRGQFSEGPGDSCDLFSPESHFSSYGSDGQYQFDETGMSISNKLFYWKNSR